MAEAGEFKYCAVCGFVLDHRASTDEWLHVHTGRQDHIPVPVERSELHAINVCCDICDGQPVTHEWPADDFTVVGTDARSVGGWALCADCAPLAARGDLRRLVTRGMVSVRDKGLRRVPRKMLERQYDELSKHLTGPPRPVQASDA